MSIAKTPEPPYYAVIFTSLLKPQSPGYEAMAERMVELASKESGFLGIESAREEVGITVSYWSDLESIKNWKANSEHINAQSLGKNNWYANYKVRIARIERDYGI